MVNQYNMHKISNRGLYGFTGRMYDISLSISQVCMHLSCSHLVLNVWVSPSFQEKLNHLQMAIEASLFKCCPTILYGRMDYSNHMRWLHNRLMKVHKNCLMEVACLHWNNYWKINCKCVIMECFYWCILCDIQIVVSYRGKAVPELFHVLSWILLYRMVRQH